MFRLCLAWRERRRSHALRGTVFSYAYAIGLVSTLFLCLAVNTVSATQDSTRQVRPASVPVALLAIAHLNFDCYPDSIYGWQDEQFHFLPHEIHWGLPLSGSGNESCTSETPKQCRKRITTITYPDWTRLTGSVAFERLNNDTLTDLVIYLHGGVSSGTNGGSETSTDTPHDSLLALAIFGQANLDSVAEIDLAHIERFQSAPFFAMELVPGTDLLKPGKRDFSGAQSFELKRLTLNVRRTKDTVSHGPLGNPVAGASVAPDGIDAAVTVHVYPNPAATSASIEAAPIAPGTYTVEVIAVNGTVSLRQDITIQSARSLLSAFDVSGLASGYYVVRLYSAQKSIGTYPIIISR